ncbi:MAG TPA: hypothetical protein VGB18_08905 [Candidatus Thermoplasmatota archaeon]
MNADRIGAIAVAAGPLILLAGILWHPFIPDLRDNADVVRHMQADTGVWFGAHFVVAVGSAVLLLGLLAVRAHVRTTVGREPWTGRAIAPLVVGSILFAMLPAMEIGMLAVEKTGGDLLATHNALDTWFTPILVIGSFIFGVGMILFAVGVHKANILPTGLSRLVVAAFVVSALSRIPFTAALIAGIVALNVAMLPLAATMWKAGSVDRPSGIAA